MYMYLINWGNDCAPAKSISRQIILRPSSAISGRSPTSDQRRWPKDLKAPSPRPSPRGRGRRSIFPRQTCLAVFDRFRPFPTVYHRFYGFPRFPAFFFVARSHVKDNRLFAKGATYRAPVTPSRFTLPEERVWKPSFGLWREPMPDGWHGGRSSQASVLATSCFDFLGLARSICGTILVQESGGNHGT